MLCRKVFGHVNISNGLFFLEKMQRNFHNAQRTLFNLYANTVAVMRLHLSKKNNPLLKNLQMLQDLFNYCQF